MGAVDPHLTRVRVKEANNNAAFNSVNFSRLFC